ncbi:MAG: PEP-CTERM sorting domain-containing protein [Planctomycetes bacterium]|nr:PEP-CTERM sorting domain-containing protein [Planctomycetota bacterium]
MQQGYNFILAKHGAGGNQNGSWTWGATRVPDKDAARQYFIATPWAYELVGQDAFPHDAWRHLTMTYDDGAGTYEFWTHDFDGVEIKLLGYETGTYVANIMNNDDDLGIGAQAFQGGVFQGLLDEVCMFDHALTEGEIHTLVPEPGSLALIATGALALVGRRR